MELRAIAAKLTGRVSRNILFWVFASFFIESGNKLSWPSFPALLLVTFISYGITGYIHNLVIIPRYLVTRKYSIYIGLFSVLLTITVIDSYYATHAVNKLIPSLNYMGALKDVALPYHVFPSLIMLSFLAFGKFMSDAVQNQRRLEELENERLNGELYTLRAQVNPHFLFNALNTIYGMARRTDMETADAVLKLSDILRYGLYECDDHKTDLEVELQYLKQFVEFSRLRVHDKESIQLSIHAPGAAGQTIAPMLLTPFVENAIKHGQASAGDSSKIEIDIRLEGRMLHFSCVNGFVAKPPKPEGLSKQNGIGNKNVERRLELLYKDKYGLQITNAPDKYSVQLNLQLQ